MFEEYYGFTARPFQLTPDPNFYFESVSHRKALSYLGYGMAQAEGFIVITGEIGAGKSTLVAHLMQKIDRDQMTVGQIVTSNLNGTELALLAAQSFGIEVEGKDKSSALSAIENFLHEEAREGRRCMLVVDESQNLSVDALEELRMLSNFQLGSHPLLQTLLLGQPEFKQVLTQHPELEQLRQRVIAAHHLEGMEEDEVPEYIMHRLTCAGWRGNPQFNHEVFGEIYNATRGIPRRVNQVATRLLLLCAVEQKTHIDRAMLSSVIEEMKSDSGFSEDAFDNAKASIPAGASSGPVKHAIAQAEAAPVQAAPAPVQAPAQASAQAPDGRTAAQIAMLQKAVIELSRVVEAAKAKQEEEQKAADDYAEQILALESKVTEQEEMLRRVLSTVIEWVETGKVPRAA